MKGWTPFFVWRKARGNLPTGLSRRPASQGASRPMRAFKNPRKGRMQALERLEKVALKHFVARGFASATMDEMAAGAGMSKATVYSWFPGKAALSSAIATASCAVQALHDVAVRVVSVVHGPDFVGLCRLAAESHQDRTSAARHAVTRVLGEARQRLEHALQCTDEGEGGVGLDARTSASMLLNLLLDCHFEAAIVGLEGASDHAPFETSVSAVAFILMARRHA